MYTNRSQLDARSYDELNGTWQTATFKQFLRNSATARTTDGVRHNLCKAREREMLFTHWFSITGPAYHNGDGHSGIHR